MAQQGLFAKRFRFGGKRVVRCHDEDEWHPAHLVRLVAAAGRTFTGQIALVRPSDKKDVRTDKADDPQGEADAPAAAEEQDEPSFRTWTSANGSSTIEAEYVKRVGKVVVLRRQDSGKVIVLDSRLLTKSYGQIFLNSLPEGIRISKLRI